MFPGGARPTTGLGTGPGNNLRLATIRQAMTDVNNAVNAPGTPAYKRGLLDHEVLQAAGRLQNVVAPLPGNWANLDAAWQAFQVTWNNIKVATPAGTALTAGQQNTLQTDAANLVALAAALT